jgi:predicted DNA-binding transcriptional regulator AlpA
MNHHSTRPAATEGEIDPLLKVNVDRLLPRKVVRQLTSLGNTAMHEAIRRREFPAPVWLTPSGSRVAWTESSIAAWIQSRVELSKQLGAAGRARGPNSRHGGV